MLQWWELPGGAPLADAEREQSHLPLAPLHAQTRPAGRPNIVYIMTDDHAAHAISAYGSRVNTAPRSSPDSIRTSTASPFAAQRIPEPLTFWDSYGTRTDALKENRQRVSTDLTNRDLKRAAPPGPS